MKQPENLSFDQATICQCIEVLVKSMLMRTLVSNQLDILKEIWIKAKSMNRKLVENKYGYLPYIHDNSWDEKDWEEEFKELRKFKK